VEKGLSVARDTGDLAEEIIFLCLGTEERNVTMMSLFNTKPDNFRKKKGCILRSPILDTQKSINIEVVVDTQHELAFFSK